jgi:hypothetical protein
MSEKDANKLYQQATESTSAAVLHARIMGRSREIALDLLDIGPASSDQQIRDAVARFMEISPEQLKGTVVERHENGNMTLRPEAVFG